MRQNVQFYDACVVEEFIYFSATEFNGLFRTRMGESEAEYIGSFPNEHIMQKMLYRSIFKNKNCLYFVPYTGRGIAVVSLEKNKIEHIPVNEKQVINFSNMLAVNSGYILIPNNVEQDFCLFSPEENTITRLDSISNIFRGIETTNTLNWFDTFGSCLVDNNTIVVALAETDILVQIKINTFETKKFSLHDTKLANIYYFENKIWATSISGNRIISFDLKTELKKEYILPDSQATDRPFYKFVSYNKTLLLLPCQGEWIWRYDIESDCWNKYINPFDIDGFERVLPYTLFFGWKISGNYLYLLPRSGSGMLKIDLTTDAAEVIPVYIGGESLEHLKEVQREKTNILIDKAVKDYGVLFEDTYDLTLKNFINYVNR